MGLEVVMSFRKALDGFAGGGGFTVELGEEVVLEDHVCLLGCAEAKARIK